MKRVLPLLAVSLVAMSSLLQGAPAHAASYCDYLDSDGYYYVAGTDGNDTLSCPRGERCFMVGGEGNDTIEGSHLDDIICGGPGHDVLRGRDGHDEIHGDDGNDSINGGQGDDYLDGWADHDIIYGGAGDDYIHGDNGTNHLNGAGGYDTCYAFSSWGRMLNCEY